MALSVLQSLCKKRLSVSFCRSMHRSLILPNQRRVHRLDMDTRFTYTVPQNYDRQLRLPLMGVRSVMSSGPWSLGPKKKPPEKKDDMGGEGPHTTIWAGERLTGIILMVLFPLDLLIPSSVFEIVITLCAVSHSHWGFENVLADYFRVIVVGRIVHKASHMVLYATSILVFIGLMKLILSGPGISESIKVFWALSGG